MVFKDMSMGATAGMFSRLAIASLIASSLTGCGTIFYKKTDAGAFTGKLDVEWIAPNQFIYRPNKDDPLKFTRSDGTVIQPQLMYTDGGSIPRLFWSAPSLGPWDFAPAYIIHDWLFEQHHCKVGDWQKYDVSLAAKVLAEGIKTQMEGAKDPQPVIAFAIYEAVDSSIAKRLWDEGQCSPPPATLDAEKLVGAKPVVILKVEAK